MLKKYAKRFSRTVMGGLGPEERSSSAVTAANFHGSDVLDGRSMTTYATIEEDQSGVYRWPPVSRKVIDDELENGAELGRRSPRRPPRRNRPHLSSCSSSATSASTTGEEGFGSESSLEELRIIHAETKTTTEVEADALKIKSSSISSLSSTGSDAEVLEMVSQLRSTLHYYPLVSTTGMLGMMED